MSTTTNDILEHYGVKGMKWGIRKDLGSEGKKATNKKITKLDKKFEKNAQNPRTTINVYNRGASIANTRIETINSKPIYKNKDFTQPSPLRDKYVAEHQQNLISGLKQATKELGTNASGTRKYTIFVSDDGGWDIHTADVKHADSETIRVTLELDKAGYISSYTLTPKTIAQSNVSSTSGDILEHYGVKGMKWGVITKKRQNRKEARRERQVEKFRKTGRSEATAQRMATRRKNANKELAKAAGQALLYFGAIIAIKLLVRDIILNNGGVIRKGASFAKDQIKYAGKQPFRNLPPLNYPDAIDVKEVFRTASDGASLVKRSF